MNKRDLSERDICTKFITPALQDAGWDIMTQVREEVTFTNGRIIVRGRMVTRGKAQRADYILFFRPNLPIAVIEAKDNTHTIGAGMQQALEYADTLDVPFVFSSNGDGFLCHDKTVYTTGGTGTVEQEVGLDGFPSPDALWARYCAWKGLDAPEQEIVLEEYYDDGSGKTPRYYQHIAINRTIETVARGQQRVLLVMATGTGKTYTAFQIMWRLWRAGRAKRILFLADRNILVDQAKNNDFSPFGQVVHKITRRRVDKSYEVYLALYQAITGPEARQKIFRRFSPDFFDLIVIDECHRGSAAEDSAWREILDYFTTAIQIGLTATPKETSYVSNIDYFGAPVYTYSLRQGIDDGFLAPYKVIRVDLDRDLQGWRPPVGKLDKHGQLIEDRVYNQKDFDRSLVLEQRIKLVARRLTEFLQATDRMDKTIVFCEDIDHAERMRSALVNLNGDLMGQDRRYILRITGDNDVGKAELDNFIDPESSHPVIVTTSKLLTTGVDAQTCKVIVLDRIIGSMTEFKQIIGRGTRIKEEYGKQYFAILDFRKATDLFADPDFDGDPVQVYVPGPDDPIVPPGEEEGAAGDEGAEGESTTAGVVIGPNRGGGRTQFEVDDVGVTILAEREQYYDAQGRLVTETLRDYSRRSLRQEFASLDEFLRRWQKADRKQAIIDELKAQGLLLESLAAEVDRNLDPFDLICHVAFDQPPLTRYERANNVRKRDYFTRYGEQARAILNALLDKYADEGLTNLEDLKVLQLAPFDTMGTPLEILKLFGGRNGYDEALAALKDALYDVAA